MKDEKKERGERRRKRNGEEEKEKRKRRKRKEQERGGREKSRREEEDKGLWRRKDEEKIDLGEIFDKIRIFNLWSRKRRRRDRSFQVILGITLWLSSELPFGYPWSLGS